MGIKIITLTLMAAFFNRYLCGATIFVVLLFHLQIVNVEEDFLLEVFGEEYAAYKKKVCRYIGRRI